MSELLELARNENIRLLKELAEKDKIIGLLRDEPAVAREAIKRYCPPELLPPAYEWLKSNGL